MWVQHRQKRSPNDTTYTITGLDNTTRYYFRVSAVNKQGYEGTSSTIDITPTLQRPGLVGQPLMAVIIMKAVAEVRFKTLESCPRACNPRGYSEC